MYTQLTVKEPQPVPVTLADPAADERLTLLGPKYTEPGAEAFWRPVADGVRALVARHGLEGSLMLGLAGDYVPPKETVLLWQKLLPEARWITMAHGRTRALFGVPVGYSTTVFGAAYAVDPAIRRFLGWQNPENVAYFPRFSNPFPPSFERLSFEKGISGNMRGMGRQSLDDFARLATSWGSSGCCWGSLTLAPCWLAPGTNGAITSVRFEMGREGIQECEARIFVEKALTNDATRVRLDAALAARAQAVVDERTRCVILADEKGENGSMHTSMPGGPLGFDWFAGSGWQTRSAKLYAVATEIAAALAPPPNP